MKKRILFSAFLTTVLLSTSLFSKNIQCHGDHCKIDLSKLSPSRNIPVKIIAFKETPVVSIQNEINVNSELIALDSSKYLKQENEVLDIEKDEETIVLAHSKYIAQQDEELEYVESSIISEPIEKIENKILNKSLPSSNYYCADEKRAIYHQESDSYECA